MTNEPEDNRKENETYIQFNCSWDDVDEENTSRINTSLSDEDYFLESLLLESDEFKESFKNKMKELNFNRITKVPKIYLMEESFMILKEQEFALQKLEKIR